MSLDLFGDDGLFDFGNSRGNFNLARAGIGAIENRATLPHAEGVCHHFQPLVQMFIARIKDEAMGLNDGGRAYIFVISPETGALGHERRDRDAFRRGMQPRAISR